MKLEELINKLQQFKDHNVDVDIEIPIEGSADYYRVDIINVSQDISDGTIVLTV